MYFLNYVDRNAIAQARLNNLEEDLNMSGTQFNTTVSMYGSLRKVCLCTNWADLDLQFVRGLRLDASS